VYLDALWNMQKVILSRCECVFAKIDRVASEEVTLLLIKSKMSSSTIYCTALKLLAL